MGSCQNKAGIIIKANTKELLEKSNLNDEKYQMDPRFDDMPEWPRKKLILLNKIKQRNVIGELV